MIISAIVAADLKNAIGIKNQIPWYLPADLKYFKKHTVTHHVIMGRNTYDSLGKPLSDRINIVLTRDYYFVASDCLIAHDIDEAFRMAQDADEDEVFIIGGAQIYDATQSYWDRIYLTRVHTQVADADAFFPAIDLSVWKLISADHHVADSKNNFDYTFEVYEKVKKDAEEE